MATLYQHGYEYEQDYVVLIAAINCPTILVGTDDPRGTIGHDPLEAA